MAALEQRQTENRSPGVECPEGTTAPYTSCSDHSHHDHDPLDGEHGHSHDHSHPGHQHGEGAYGHSHLTHASTARELAVAVGLTSLILIVEVVGGIFSHSLALLSDAAHMVTDVASLGLAWYAHRQSARPPTERLTYGYHRSGIMAALVNAVTLIGIAIFIGLEAWDRILHPPRHLVAPVMLSVALVALVVNLGIARLLQHESHNLNVRSALLHVLGDAAASAGVLVAGVAILWEPRWIVLDPVLSIGIALIIVWGAWQILMETLNVLMEGTPTGLDLAEVEASLASVEGVREVHHVHVWSLCPGHIALSGHVVLEDQALSETEGIRSEILRRLSARHQVNHATIQFEHQQCGLVCTLNGYQQRG